MTAITTPEVIQPNELYALPSKGDGFVQVLNNGLPNLGNCIQLLHTAGSERLQLRQPLRADSHFMVAETTGASPFPKNGLSFWIRPRQEFAGTAVTTNAGLRPELAAAPILMGVGNPAVPDAQGWGSFGWLIVCSSNAGVPQIQFVQQYRQTGYGTVRKWASAPIVCPIDEWTFVAISNRYSFFEPGSTSTSYSGLYYVYRNGVLNQISTPTAGTFSGGSGLSPLYNLNAALAYFAIGDPTGGGNAVRGVGNGPLVDLGQIAFNVFDAPQFASGDAITDVEAFQLYEAMIYG